MKQPIVRYTRSTLESRADDLRERLLDTVALLESRARSLTSVGTQIRRHSGFVGAIFGGSIILLTFGLSYEAFRLRTRGPRRRRQRLVALRRSWDHPELVARTAPSLGSSLLRKLAVGTLGFLGVELAKRGVRRLMPPPAPRVREVLVSGDARALAQSEARRIRGY